ncbi:MAG: hypothetical protein AAGJ82_02145, partial [Bacteroidota bacterium]
VYPGESYNDAKFKSLLHFLTVQIRRYLAFAEMEQDTQQQQLYLCQALRKRNIDSAFEKSWNKLARQRARPSIQNAHSHYQNYQLQLERYTFFHRARRTERFHLQELTESLTTFYVAEMLRQTCIMISARNMAAEGYEVVGLAQVLQQAAHPKLEQQAAVAIYHQAYLMLTETEAQHHERLADLLEIHRHCFPTDELRDIYLLAINYCIKRLNQGDRAYIREAFNWYQKGLAQRILFENGILSPYTYYNALMLSIGLEEWDWGGQFLDDYRQHLPPTERQNSYTYSRAVYSFRKGDYSTAMGLLQQVTFKDELYNLNARSMLLRMYYELCEWDALDALLDSFTSYIRRQKRLGYHRENYLNLIRFTRQLLRLAPTQSAGRKQLIQRIEETKSLAEKDWLLAQTRM